RRRHALCRRAGLRAGRGLPRRRGGRDSARHRRRARRLPGPLGQHDPGARGGQMTARGLRGAMAAAGAAAALGIAALAWAMADARVGQAEAYARERAAQRRAVAMTRPAQPPAPTSAPARKVACVLGLGTFAVAVERALVPLPDGRARRVAALKAISDAAVRAERGAELARPAPTLPRRMGAGVVTEPCYAELR